MISTGSIGDRSYGIYIRTYTGSQIPVKTKLIFKTFQKRTNIKKREKLTFLEYEYIRIFLLACMKLCFFFQIIHKLYCIFLVYRFKNIIRNPSLKYVVFDFCRRFSI